jgi:hypothetical protein
MKARHGGLAAAVLMLSLLVAAVAAEDGTSTRKPFWVSW